jgi:hypothetical protein
MGGRSSEFKGFCGRGTLFPFPFPFPFPFATGFSVYVYLYCLFKHRYVHIWKVVEILGILFEHWKLNQNGKD